MASEGFELVLQFGIIKKVSLYRGIFNLKVFKNQLKLCKKTQYFK